LTLVPLPFSCRFFPCVYNSSNSHNSIETASQLHRELTAEQIAALQQGSAAWHLGRSGHITGSTVTDLLGFDCPAINRLLAAHGVYHAVKDGRQGVAKLQAATAKLRGEPAATGTAHMGPFGMLCCEFGSRCGSTSACSEQHEAVVPAETAVASPDLNRVCRDHVELEQSCKSSPCFPRQQLIPMDKPLTVDAWLLITAWLQQGLAPDG
jgi:hypothetical protein